MKAKMPVLPEVVTFETIQVYKSAMRRYDRQRIANREATPEQIQKENEIFHTPKQVRILRIPEMEFC